jgi:hypothetical protein
MRWSRPHFLGGSEEIPEEARQPLPCLTSQNYVGAVDRAEKNISTLSLARIPKALKVKPEKFWVESPPSKGKGSRN